MKEEHYKEKLSAFVDQELDRDERSTIAEHLMTCDKCREEHDKLRIGAGLAAKLERSDAPTRTWNNILAELDGRGAPRIQMLAAERWFNLRSVTAALGAIAIIAAFSVLVYRGVLLNDRANSAQEALDPNGQLQVVEPGPSGQQDDHAAITNSEPTNTVNDPASAAAAWQFETLAGSPKVVGGPQTSALTVGGYLETDSASRARIAVANVGNVEIKPNSRVQLVSTSETEHRLSLERGGIHAVISAPPRLFIVDTPSGKAVDLGCEYTLEVDKAGNSKLHVMTGFVALERGGRESWVPAGAMCLTSKAKGLGTPFSAEATPEFERALRNFDFGKGGHAAVREMLDLADFYDIVTLWHLLSRVPASDRPYVFDRLAKFVAPPDGVTRDGILALDRAMLDSYRTAVETAWFE